jgi:hypothetical protein
MLIGPALVYLLKSALSAPAVRVLCQKSNGRAIWPSAGFAAAIHAPTVAELGLRLRELNREDLGPKLKINGNFT